MELPVGKDNQEELICVDSTTFCKKTFIYFFPMQTISIYPTGIQCTTAHERCNFRKY